MSGEHHESGERDWRDDPGRTLDELSGEEILRALTGLDELLKANAADTYSLLARGDAPQQAGRRPPGGGGLQQGHRVGAG